MSGFTFVIDSMPDCDAYGTASGDVIIPAAGDNWFGSTIVNASGEGGGWIDLYVPEVVYPTVEAAPAAAAFPAGGAYTHEFLVTNPDFHHNTVSASVICSGAAISCSVPPVVTVPAIVGACPPAPCTPAPPTPVAVTYTLTGQPRDSGFITLTVSQQGSAEATARIRVIAREPVIARDQCLAIATGNATRHECGDLRIVHALPAVRTMGQTRAPVLTYLSSHTIPFPIVRAVVSFGSIRPDSVVAYLTLDTLPTGRRAWPKSQFPANSTRGIGLGIRADSLQTGIYHYTLVVHKQYDSGADTVMLTDTGSVVVVNRIASPFGVGWWLAGFEQLLLGDTAGPLWVGGDGSVRRFRAAGPGAWAAIPVSRPENLYRTSDSGYVRLVSGDSIIFDSLGRHVRTVNRLGHRTDFFVSGAGRLDSLRVAPAAAGLAYRFEYGASGRLDSVMAPGVSSARTIRLTLSNGRIAVIKGPDADSVRFDYASAPNTRRISARIDRRGIRTRFVYDNGGRFDETRLGLAAGDTIRQLFTNWESRAIAGAANAVDTANLFTLYDGPRAAADSDRTAFWPDRFGGVRRIGDAYHNQTLIARTDARWPGLPTRVQYANGRIVAATYDGRGNATTVTDSNPYGTGTNPTTTSLWDQRFDVPVYVRLPNGQFRVSAIDSTNGQLLWTQDGRGIEAQVKLRYYTSGNGAGLIRAVQTPDGFVDSLTYDGFFNVASYRTALGWTTTYLSDAVGRLLRTLAPIGPLITSSNYRRDSLVYDVRDRISQTISMGPAFNGAPEQVLTVTNYYNRESAIDSVSRAQSPDTADIGVMWLRWAYDAANRPVVAIAEDGERDSTWFDHAGNVDSVRTRRAHRIRMGYDRMNRLVWRVIPQVTYPSSTVGIIDFGGHHYPFPRFPNDSTGGLTLAADSEAFSYDNMGNLTRADNGDAQVWRGYFKTGQIQWDSTRLRTIVGNDFTRHIYGMRYAYDLNARPSLTTYPVQLARNTNDSARTVSLAYNDTTGALSGMTDLTGATFAMRYSPTGQLTRLLYPGGVADSLGYDADGRLVLDRLENSDTTGTDRFPDPVIRHSRIAYGDPIRVTSARDSVGYQDSTFTLYSGLGAMVRLRYYLTRQVINNTPAPTYNRQTFVVDPLANIATEYDTSTTASWLYENNVIGRRLNLIDSAGRLVRTVIDNSRTDTTVFNAAGDLEAQYSIDWQPNTALWLLSNASYYDAAGRLRRAERRDVRKTALSFENASYALVSEEYRYDALGRRVLVWARKECAGQFLSYPGPCRMSTIRRTVWDGAREAMEITMPGRLSDSTQWWENDTASVIVAVDSSPGYFDPNPWFGRVGYSYGGGVDRPLSVTRWGYHEYVANFHADSTFAPFSFVPYWNWRGQADYGLTTAGLTRQCKPGTTRCTTTSWRHRAFGWGQTAGLAADPDSFRTFVWLGTLVNDKEDATGTLYRRNRYLDPATGRFTQEDPIGLAAGLNAYGFATGDPINLDDPFGLCPPKTIEVDDCDPADPLTKAWQILEGSRAGRAVIMAFVKGGVVVDAAVAGSGCKTACTTGPAGGQRVVHVGSRSSTAAMQLSHEITHAIGSTKCGNASDYLLEEVLSWKTAFGVYDAMTAWQQRQSGYSSRRALWQSNFADFFGQLQTAVSLQAASPQCAFQ